MKTAYLSIGYICNEGCRYCPCAMTLKKSGLFTQYNELIENVDSFIKSGIERIVISGGEPTLHPYFIKLINYLQKKNIKTIILSNGERFSDQVFLDEFGKNTRIDKLTVITTLHSHKKNNHEKANQTPGSYIKTMNGLNAIVNMGATLIIKHCVTKENFFELPEFYQFIDESFPQEVSMQICSIDYCGVPDDMLQKEMLSFIEIKPYLERMFDIHISNVKEGNKRNVYCINFPLCSCDVYYWKYIRKKQKNVYQLYKDPRIENAIDANDNVGISPFACKDCKVKSICTGTYLTAFEYFGDAIIRPIL